MNPQQNIICIPSFFGMIIFDDKIRNFVPTVEVLRQYLENSDTLLTDLLFSNPQQEIRPLANVLSALFFDEIFDELIFELPMRCYTLFPDDFDFMNEGRWFALMNDWKNLNNTLEKTLLLCGDVESNPGPQQSRPVVPRNNDPRRVQLEKAISQRQGKIRTLTREIERLTKMTNPRAQGVYTDIKKIMTTATTIDSDTISDLSGNISKIISFIENNLPVLQESFKTTGLQFSQNMVEVKEDLIKIIIFIILIQLFMKFERYRSAVALVLLFTCQHYGLHKKILDMIRELMEKLKQPRSQVDMEDVVYNPIFDLCGKIMFGFLAFICVKKIPGKQDWDNFILRLDRIPKAIGGSTKIVDLTTKYWNLAHDSIKMMVLGKTREELQIASSVYTEIDEWAAEIRKYLTLAERNKIDSDEDVASKVENLYKEGLEFRMNTLLPKDVMSFVISMLLPAKQLYEYVVQSPVKGGGPRMKPICVWLCGESGIGKTEMVYPLCIDVLRTMGMPTETAFKHQVYARQVETEYWTAYHGQKIVIYDDAFQKKDDRVTGNPELFEVIRSCNTFPHHLHMAAISDKNTFSAAELMLYTTNEMNVDINSLTYPDAFKNRMFENAYVVQLKPEYRIVTKHTGKPDTISLDKSKLSKEQAIDLSIYLFQKKDKHGMNVGEPIEYHELATLIAELWKEQKNLMTGKMKWLNEYATRPRAQCDSETFVDCPFDFASDIATRINNGESLEQIESDYVEDQQKFNEYLEWCEKGKSVSIWKKCLNRCEIYYSRFKVKLNSLLSEANEIISGHPYLSMLGLVGSILVVFQLYSGISSLFKEKDDDAEIEVDGDRCTIRQSSGNQVRAEVVSSGDSRTIRPMRPTVEVMSSGDVKTQRIQRARVEIANSGDTRTLLNARPKIECDALYLADYINGRQPHAQGCSDEPCLQLVTDVILKNTYKLLVKTDTHYSYIGNVTFIKGWNAVMPYHFLETFKIKNLFNTTLCLTQNGIDHLIQFDVSFLITKSDDGFKLTKNVVRLEHMSGEPQDCVVFCLHRTMCQPHRNILPHIVTQEDLSSLTGYLKGTMSTFHKHNGQLSRMYHTFGEIQKVDSAIEIDLDSEGMHYYTQRSYYSYRVSTAEGDCGSLIGIFSKRMPRKLIGMHIAGDANGIAYACPLTLERLNKALDKLTKAIGPIAQFEYALDDLVDSSQIPELPEGGFVPIGKSKLKNGQAVKTALLKSRIYNKLRKATMAPAVLKPIMINGQMINPLMNGLMKCGKIPTLLDNDDIYACANNIGTTLRTNFAGIDLKTFQRVLSYQEAVKGAGDDFMTSVNRVTSPGFPYSQWRLGKPGKTRWLGCNENFDFTSEDSLCLQKDVQQLIEDCKNGIIRGVYCADTLKDEKRDIEKVKMGKTRVFSACPVHFVLAFRQYFLGFSAWCMHNRIDNEVAVGTNQYSLDWHQIGKRLQQKGSPVIAGDFSNFDGSLNAQILWAILDIINQWYDDGEENRTIRTGLWCHVVHSTHIFNDNVYMWTHSQPSGNPFTVIINSIYNSIVMRMAWQIVMRPHGLSGMNHFNTYVSMVSYGDDNVLNISRKVIDYFNQESIAEALATIGHTYTDETKSGEMVKYRSLKDINFLKRSFVFSEELQRFIAPLEERVIYEMLNWTRNTIDPDEILMMNVQTAAREMALHGLDKFNTFVTEVRQIENCFRLCPQILTYKEYLYDFRDNPQSFFD